MKILSAIVSTLMTPYLLFVYWRNSVRQISNVHNEREIIGWFEN